jgi:hypothetical protein
VGIVKGRLVKGAGGALDETGTGDAAEEEEEFELLR